MSEHQMRLHWQKRGDFSHQGFDRQHHLEFQPNVGLIAGGANNDFGADPEQLLAAALASCHMQTFLALAAKKRLIVADYQDQPVAIAESRDDGKIWVSVITLSPKVVFAGDQQPDVETVRTMHEKAHQHCFVANSIRSEIRITPR